MHRFNFDSNSILKSLYIEFKSTTEYIHSVRRANDKKQVRVEPYEPSMFIFSFFTFNTLYNIYWKKTVSNGCQEVVPNTRKIELDRIYDYLEYIWSSNGPKEIAIVFRTTIEQVIRQYLSEKGLSASSESIARWITDNMNKFDLGPKKDGKGNKFKEDDIKTFKEYIIKPFNNQNLELSEIQHIIKIIYLVRCNLFHGAKDPEFFEEHHQMERFVLYAAALTAINQLLFSTINRKLYRCAR